jgi:uncharacterized membrane protein (DUF4010 family)
MILAAVMTWFRTNPRNVWLIAGLVAALGILLFVYLKGRDDQAGAAATQAALERAETERKLTDAVASAPDSVPDAVVVQYGCEQLRQAGARVADLPACRPAGR